MPGGVFTLESMTPCLISRTLKIPPLHGKSKKTDQHCSLHSSRSGHYPHASRMKASGSEWKNTSPAL
uniref:Uncharacterized protein n=1 Tax=Anguilla anguilla TaxID=7936 RepID=A0A0E9PG22_ANGAN